MFIPVSQAVLSVFLSLLFVLNLFAAPNEIDFFAAKTFGGNNAMFYATQGGDFDGDGKVDVLTSSYNTVYVFFGDGTGEFRSAPVSIYEFLGGTTNVPVAGDFNGDGRSDVALLRRNPQTLQDAIAIYHGTVNRTFADPIYSSPTPIPKTIFTGDLDNDGKLDLLGKAQPAGNVIEFYKGDGAGSFAATAHVAASNTGIIAVADLDNDGLRDVVFTGDDALSYAKNLGSNTFGPPVVVDQLDYGFANLVVSDVNNDGDPDLIASQQTATNNVTPVWLGSTGTGFTFVGDLEFGLDHRVTIVSIDDLNNDGLKDLSFAASNRTIIRMGNGNGTFQFPDIYTDGGSGLFVADVDSDNFRDLVVAQSIEFATIGSGSFSVMRNLGEGLFKSAPALKMPRGTKDLVVANLNSDQLKDIVVVNRGSGGGPGDVFIFFQDTAAGFSKSSAKDSTFQLGGIGIDAFSVVAGKFDSDNLNDAVVVGHGAFGAPQNALFLKNAGFNTFVISHFQIGTGDINDVATADLNNDGKLDLVTANGSVQVSFGNGDGTFAAPANYVGTSVTKVAVGDVNNDQRPDIAAFAQNSGGSVSVLLNNGTGVFTVPTTFTPGAGTSDLLFSHLNGDGNLDLAIAHGTGISIYPGNGNATFGSPQTVSLTQVSVYGLTTGDWNSDGHEDIAALAGRNTMVTFVNNGSGVFTQERMWGAGVETVAVTAADFDNDEKVDIIAGFDSKTAGYIKFYQNTTLKVPPASTAPFDFDGDGKTDLGIFRPSVGQWWINQSSSGSTFVAQFGNSADKIMPADFTGDSKTDIALWRPSTGQWFVLRSEDSSFYSVPFGLPGDIPSAADFDADGKADTTIFRPSTATWYIQRSGDNGTTIQTFGQNGDLPVVADYDGDGKADIAIFRPSAGQWWLLRSTAGVIAASFGNSTDKLVPGDYTGDGKANVALWRPSTGQWFILRWGDFSYYSVPFGLSGDIPAPGDYDGDGKFDTTVFRPGTATWYSQRSTGGTLIQLFGAPTDMPIPNAFVP